MKKNDGRKNEFTEYTFDSIRIVTTINAQVDGFLISSFKQTSCSHSSIRLSLLHSFCGMFCYFCINAAMVTAKQSKLDYFLYNFYFSTRRTVMVSVLSLRLRMRSTLVVDYVVMALKVEVFVVIHLSVQYDDHTS